MNTRAVAGEVDLARDSRLLFVGKADRADGHLAIEGHAGQVRVDGSASELASAESLLATLDGWTYFSAVLSLTELDPDHCWTLARGLAAVGAAADLSEGWRGHHRLSCNPPTHGRLMLFDMAYELDRWEPEGGQRRGFGPEHQSYLSDLARRRRSTPLGDLTAGGQSAFEAALQLAADTYRLRDESRPIAAGGALYPLHFWVGGAQGGKYEFYALDHDSEELVDWTTVTTSVLQDAFVQDEEVAHAINVGAGLIIVGADPRRTVLKYGDRAWRYILMEVGAVAHHMTLESVELGVSIRPIGGFFDQPIAELLSAPIVPLLTLFVGHVGEDA